MKNRILTLMLILSIMFSAPGCGIFKKICHKKTEAETVMGASQSMVAKTYNFTGWQVDSLCSADGLPEKFPDGWLRKSYTDFETQKPVVKYMYIKDLTENEEIIYLITPQNDVYIVVKRQVITKEEE